MYSLQRSTYYTRDEYIGSVFLHISCFKQRKELEMKIFIATEEGFKVRGGMVEGVVWEGKETFKKLMSNFKKLLVHNKQVI